MDSLCALLAEVIEVVGKSEAYKVPALFTFKLGDDAPRLVNEAVDVIVAA